MTCEKFKKTYNNFIAERRNRSAQA